MRLKVILTCSALLLVFGLQLAAVPNGDDVVSLEKKTWELWQGSKSLRTTCPLRRKTS
jgi:hypothetical protein